VFYLPALDNIINKVKILSFLSFFVHLCGFVFLQQPPSNLFQLSKGNNIKEGSNSGGTAPVIILTFSNKKNLTVSIGKPGVSLMKQLLPGDVSAIPRKSQLRASFIVSEEN